MSDILILGATDFAGGLIARYLANPPQRTSSSFTLALGGRSREQLNRIATSLGLSTDPDSIVVVDPSDYASVEGAVVRAKVVISAIRPHRKSGEHVVRACAMHGVHYVDITPEPHFIADIVTKYDFVALKTNALIIPACGFDSVLSDVAVYVSNRYVKSVLGPRTSIEDSVTAYDVSGGFFGLISSIMRFVGDVPREKLIKSANDYALRHPKGPPSHLERFVYKLPYNASSSWYGAVLPQRMINRQTIHHSWSLFERNKGSHPEDAYGNKFRYDECFKTPGPISALFVDFSILLFITALLVSPIRWMLKQILPQFDTGPGSDKGRFKAINITKGGSLTVKTTLKGEGESAHHVSARITGEAALAIALNFRELPYLKTGGGGVLTPMTALGDVLIRRLEDFSGVKISSESIKSGESKKTK